MAYQLPNGKILPKFGTVIFLFMEYSVVHRQISDEHFENVYKKLCMGISAIIGRL